MAGEKIDLSPSQVAALRESERWVRDALAEVGAAHLAHALDVERERMSADRLRRATELHEHAIAQRNGIMGAVIDFDALPDGDWMFDAVHGKLVKKDTP